MACVSCAVQSLNGKGIPKVSRGIPKVNTKQDLVTNCVGYVAAVGIGVTFLLGLGLQ